MKDKIEITINVVAAFYKIHPATLNGQSRVTPLPEARMMLVRVIRSFFGEIPYYKIGQMINREHSNLSRQDEKMRLWMRLYPDIKQKHDRICTLLTLRGYEKETQNPPTGSAAPAALLHAEKQPAV